MSESDDCTKLKVKFYNWLVLKAILITVTLCGHHLQEGYLCPPCPPEGVQASLLATVHGKYFLAADKK